MADHDHTYKLVRVLSNRLPGVEIPQVADLQEVKSMLAERVTEWTRQWKQEGFEEGLEKGLEKGLEEGHEKGREEGQEEALEQLRGALLREMEDRFGALPESVRGKVAAIGSIGEIARLIARTATAPSLATLEL